MIEGNYTDIIGKRVHVIVDRPAGSFHPRNHDIADGLELARADKILYADGNYAPCQGCFKCWTKHPATCEMKDAMHEISCILGQADELVIVTENCSVDFVSESEVKEGVLA